MLRFFCDQPYFSGFFSYSVDIILEKITKCPAWGGMDRGIAAGGLVELPVSSFWPRRRARARIACFRHPTGSGRRHRLRTGSAGAGKAQALGCWRCSPPPGPPLSQTTRAPPGRRGIFSERHHAGDQSPPGPRGTFHIQPGAPGRIEPRRLPGPRREI